MSQMGNDYPRTSAALASPPEPPKRDSESWYSRFAPDLRSILTGAAFGPLAPSAMAVQKIGDFVQDSGAFEPLDRRKPVEGTGYKDNAERPNPNQPKITPEEAQLRRMAGTILTGQIERGEADLSGASDRYTALADTVLLKQYQETMDDPEAREEDKAVASEYLADYEARKQQKRLEAEQDLAAGSVSLEDMPTRYVQLWAHGYSEEEINALMRDSWLNMDDDNAQRMMDRLEINADVLQDEGKFLEAQGLLRARRALMAGSSLNVNANARPFDVMLDQMIQHDVQEGGRLGAFGAAGSDAFVSTVRGIGRLTGMVPDGERDYLERLTQASYEEHPVTSFAGSFAGGVADPVFFGISMGLAKAPVTAASRARYADDMMRSGVPKSVAVSAGENLTQEGLAVHRMSRYFMNAEKSMAERGLLSAARTPLSERTAKSLATIVWNSADGMVSNAMAEGIIGASEHESPTEVAIRMVKGGALGLGMGSFLSGIFAAGDSITRAMASKVPPETKKALDTASAYVARGAEDAAEVRQMVEQAASVIDDAARLQGRPLTDAQASDVLREIGIEPEAMRLLDQPREPSALSDHVVDADEMVGAFDETPESVDATIAFAIPDAPASLAASLAEEATASRQALSDLASARRELRQVRREARVDPLTNLANRRGMEEAASAMFERADTQGKPVSVAMFDLSNFKALNDVYGHERGDEALELIARVLQEEVRLKPDKSRGRTEADLDVAGIANRPGGDEFSVFLYGADQDTAKLALQRIEERVQAELDAAGLGFIDTTRGRRHVSLVGGLAVRDAGSGATLAQLLNASDQASIVRKADLKSERGEPQGRFDISEVIQDGSEGNARGVVEGDPGEVSGDVPSARIAGEPDEVRADTDAGGPDTDDGVDTVVGEVESSKQRYLSVKEDSHDEMEVFEALFDYKRSVISALDSIAQKHGWSVEKVDERRLINSTYMSIDPPDDTIDSIEIRISDHPGRNTKSVPDWSFEVGSDQKTDKLGFQEVEDLIVDRGEIDGEAADIQGGIAEVQAEADGAGADGGIQADGDPARGLADRFEQIAQRVDADTEDGARSVLDARDQLDKNGIEYRQLLSEDARAKLRTAEDKFEGDSLPDSVRDLDPNNPADAEAIIRAREELEPTAALTPYETRRVATAMETQVKAGTGMIHIETGMDDMRVFADSAETRMKVEGLVTRARRIDKQYEGGKIPASGRAPKPSKARSGLHVTKPVKSRGDLQKSILKRMDPESRMLVVDGESVTAMNKNGVFKASTRSLSGSSPEGVFNAEGRGLQPHEAEPERLAELIDRGTGALDWNNQIADFGNIDDAALSRMAQKAALVGEDAELTLSQAPDGSIGMTASGEAGTVALGTLDDNSVVLGTVRPNVLRSNLELVQSANPDGLPVRMSVLKPPGASGLVAIRIETPDSAAVFGAHAPDSSPANPKSPTKKAEATSKPSKSPSSSVKQGMAERPVTVGPEGVGEARNVPDLVKQPAVTKSGRKLIGQITADTEGKRYGVRSIRQWLSDQLGVQEIIRREQTTKKRPANYEENPHVVRSRYQSAGYIVHEHGHAISAIMRESDPKFLKRNESILESIMGAEDSMASRKTAEEGFAEYIRRAITKPDTLNQFDPGDAIRKQLAKKPEILNLVDDAARAYQAHMNRSLDARWRSHQNDIRRETPQIRGVLRSGMVRYGARGLAGEFLYDDVMKQVNKDADSLRDGWRRVNEVESRIKDTPADIKQAYGSVLHIDQMIGIALEGTKRDGGGGGLRVHAQGAFDSEGLSGALNSVDNIEALRAAGFKIDDGLANKLNSGDHGEVVTLSRKSVAEAIRPVKDNWAQFETYAQMKATAARAEVRPGFQFQTSAEGTGLADLQLRVRELEIQNPEYKRVFADLQDIMDKTLLIDVMSGESTVADAIKLRNTFEHYLPLTRTSETGPRSANIGATTSPTSGIRRSSGSHNAAEPVLGAIHRKVAQSVNAYYWNRYMQAPVHMAQTLRKMGGVSTDAKRMADRVMLRLDLDTKKMATLSEGEESKVILDWIQKRADDFQAKKLVGEDVEEAWDFSFSPEEAANMSVADINLVYPGQQPIFRRVAPNAVNVVAPMIGGERLFYQINDPMLYSVFTGDENIPGILRGVENTIGSITQPWKNSITQTAVFALRSLARDYPTAMAFGGDKRALVPLYYHVLGAMKMMTGKAPESLSQPEIMSRTFRRVHSDDFVKQRSRMMQELAGEIVPRGWKNMNGLSKTMSAPGIAIKALLRPVELTQILSGQRAMATWMETAPRLGSYVAAKQKGLSDEAAQLTADTITGYFAERPLSPVAHSIYRMAGFVNPATQITIQYARLATDPVPARAAAKIGMMSASVASATGVLWALKELFHDKKDKAREAERTEDERLTHMDIRGLRIPFDYGIAGGIQSFVYNSLDQHAAGLPEVDRSKLAEKMLRQTLPPQALEPWELLPPVAKAGLEAKTGHSFFRNRSLLPGYMEYMEAEDQAFSTTPELYRWFGSLTDQSPAKIEHVVRNGIGVKLADTIRLIDRIADEGLNIEEAAGLPEIGRMFTREPTGWNSRSVESVQELDDEYKAIKRKIKALEEAGGASDEDIDRLKDDLDRYEPFHKAMLKISRAYEKSKDESGEEAKRLQNEMVEIAREAMEESLQLEEPRE